MSDIISNGYQLQYLLYTGISILSHELIRFYLKSNYLFVGSFQYSYVRNITNMIPVDFLTLEELSEPDSSKVNYISQLPDNEGRQDVSYS